RSRLMYLPLFLLASPRLQPLMNKLYRGSQQTQKKRERYMPAQARIGLRKLDTLAERLELRRHRAALMSSLLKSDIQPQHTPEGALSTWYFYVALVPGDAAHIRQRLLIRGVDAGAGNEIMDNCAALLGYDDCPRAEEVFSHALALPMYDGISEKACERVAKTLNRLV
ncbi:MAG TPA: DegT/DnrJ/EryC1/StrS family aminotransferase, partial [Candidatus Hydrogenedentes bacterium]|nr:DegT/DnrJ/EryC1/StrS family aminotransferase [Candidatus Hydrogenedentota bacterium]